MTAGQPVIETVVTTVGPDGGVNCAAMGVGWGGTRLVIRPFRGTRTLRNLQATGEAVVHLTDDVLLFVRAALEDPRPAVRPAEVVAGAIIPDACSWREVRVISLDETGERARVVTEVVARGTGREFGGFNRARHAVIEASILASRMHLPGHRDVAAELARLQDIVDRTAGPAELEAMALVTEHIRRGAS